MTGSLAKSVGATLRARPCGARSCGAKPYGAKTLAIAALLIGSGLSAGPAAAAVGAFLPHQAQYDLGLVKARGSNINDARGRIVYKFSGSACEGYTTEFKQFSELESGEDKVTKTELSSTSWEEGSGKAYRFKIDARMNDDDSSPVSGVAERSGDHITVKLKQPAAKTFTLDGNTVFPIQLIQRIIAAARDGKSQLSQMLYDGSDDGQKLYYTFAVIGKPIPPEQTVAAPDPSTSSDAMKSMTRWPVTVSYFDTDFKPTDGEQKPVYSMAFELYENGVSRALTLDYNDFVIAGAMDRFDVKDSIPASKPCK
jgi:hypothetical protein